MDTTEVEVSFDADCDECGATFSIDTEGFMGDSETVAEWVCRDCGSDNTWVSVGWSDLRDEYGV